ncbi:MAG: serine hydrolase domain-containing protein, partial [Dehalococcoidia bacterium]|nr:serine hydrolase domain-containing protein [Dehalococcoidia bacterium]
MTPSTQVKLLLLALFAFATTTCTADPQNNTPSHEQLAATTTELQTTLDTWREGERITGATMSVYSTKLGQINVASGLTKRSIDPDRFPDDPIAPNQSMFVGDLIHVLVAACIVQLASEESVNLNATIESRFPEIENSGQITIRNLLEHTSGIPVFYTEEFLDVLYEQSPNTSQQTVDVIAVAAEEGSFFPPSTQYGYSKTNFLVLGRIIELVTGNPLEIEIRNRFLDPLDMNDTYLAGRENVPGGTPSGYEYTGPFTDAPTAIDGHVPQVPEISVISAEWASGALVSTTSDIIKLVRAIFENEQYAEIESEMLRVAEYPAQNSGSKKINSGAGVFVWEDDDEPE